MANNNKQIEQDKMELEAMLRDPNTSPKAFGKKLDEAIKHGYRLTDPMAEYNNWHLISYAVAEGNIAMVQEILNRGYDVNQKDNSGSTPIMVVASNAEMLNFLLKKGANINDANKFKMTLLSYVVQDGNVEQAKLLISKGAKINTKHENGMTLMHYAALSGNPEMFKFLAKKGLDMNAKDKNGKTPLDYAWESEFSDADTLKALKEAGAKRGKPLSSTRNSEKGLGTLAAAQNQGASTLRNNAEPVSTLDEVSMPVRGGREIS